MDHPGAEQIIYSLDEDDQEYIAQIFAPCKDLSTRLARSRDVGTIVLQDYPSGTKSAAEPIAFVRWAISQRVELPDPLYEFESRQPRPNADATTNDPPLSRRDAQKERTRARHLRVWELFEEIETELPGRTKANYCEITSRRLLKLDGIDYAPETIRKILRAGKKLG
jgi:hypothetical protein